VWGGRRAGSHAVRGCAGGAWSFGRRLRLPAFEYTLLHACCDHALWPRSLLASRRGQAQHTRRHRPPVPQRPQSQAAAQPLGSEPRGLPGAHGADARQQLLLVLWQRAREREQVAATQGRRARLSGLKDGALRGRRAPAPPRMRKPAHARFARGGRNGRGARVRAKISFSFGVTRRSCLGQSNLLWSLRNTVRLTSRRETNACVARRARLSMRRPATAPPPLLRTKWTRRVPHPVLIGHARIETRRGRGGGGRGGCGGRLHLSEDAVGLGERREGREALAEARVTERERHHQRREQCGAPRIDQPATPARVTPRAAARDRPPPPPPPPRARATCPPRRRARGATRAAPGAEKRERDKGIAESFPRGAESIAQSSPLSSVKGAEGWGGHRAEFSACCAESCSPPSPCRIITCPTSPRAAALSAARARRSGARARAHAGAQPRGVDLFERSERGLEGLPCAQRTKGTAGGRPQRLRRMAPRANRAPCRRACRRMRRGGGAASARGAGRGARGAGRGAGGRDPCRRGAGLRRRRSRSPAAQERVRLVRGERRGVSS